MRTMQQVGAFGCMKSGLGPTAVILILISSTVPTDPFCRRNIPWFSDAFDFPGANDLGVFWFIHIKMRALITPHQVVADSIDRTPVFVNTSFKRRLQFWLSPRVASGFRGRTTRFSQPLPPTH